MAGNRPEEYRIRNADERASDERARRRSEALDSQQNSESEEPLNPRDAAFNRDAQSRDEADVAERAPRTGGEDPSGA